MPRTFLEGLLLHWLGNYDDVQNAAVLCLYIQVFAALPGCLNDSSTGLLAADLAVALFGLVAVASSYQALARAYASLLLCMLLLDASWLLLYAPLVWAKFRARSLLNWEEAEITAFLLFASATAGFAVRLFSAVLWLQMFRMGLSASDLGLSQGAPPNAAFLSDYDTHSRTGRSSTDQSPRFTRQYSASDDFLGSSIFHPPSFAAIFQPGQLTQYLGDANEDSHDSGGVSQGGSYEQLAGVPEEWPASTNKEGPYDSSP